MATANRPIRKLCNIIQIGKYISKISLHDFVAISILNIYANFSSETELRLIFLQYCDLPPLITVEDRQKLVSTNGCHCFKISFSKHHAKEVNKQMVVAEAYLPIIFAAVFEVWSETVMSINN